VREAESDHAAWSCVYSLSKDVDSLWGAALGDLVCWRCPSSWRASLLKPEIDRTVSSWVYSLLKCVGSFVGWLAGGLRLLEDLVCWRTSSSGGPRLLEILVCLMCSSVGVLVC
jgi:hypothetical protein